MKRISILALIVLSLLTGCQWTSRVAGGTAHIDLPADQKLVNASWKGNSVWVLTRHKRQGEVPETYTYKESSVVGVIQGTVIITEN